MKNYILILFTVVIMSTSILGQSEITLASGSAYRIFDGQGNPASLDKIVEAIAQTDVVFLGENHDDVVAHKLQVEIFMRVIDKYSTKRTVALSMEMFDRDVQTEVNEYLQGLIPENHFLLSTRPWGNYKTDYRMLVELAKEQKLAVIAANAPRR
jgi:uncharacterized iron-regulated protein